MIHVLGQLKEPIASNGLLTLGIIILNTGHRD